MHQIKFEKSVHQRKIMALSLRVKKKKKPKKIQCYNIIVVMGKMEG